MASIFKRGGNWWVKWPDPTGRRYPKTNRPVWLMKRTSCESKAEAKKLAADLERQSERQQLGLEARAADSTMTLAELCRWWLKHHCPAASKPIAKRRLERHVCAHALGAARLAEVTTERLEALLADQKRPDGSRPSPATVNRTRGDLHSVFERARKAKLWVGGQNPVADVETRRVAKRVYATLRAEEVPVFLPHVEAGWRNFFAAALWTGMRKGELCGLLKSDVDLRGRTLTVARSYDSTTTKGGHADVLPIAEPLVPYLEDALKRSPSAWVFPSADGSMRTDESDPQKVLRSALIRAARCNPTDAALRASLGGELGDEGAAIARGLIEGWEHVCRRCTAAGLPADQHTKRHVDADERRCQNPTASGEPCGMKLWPRALPRPLRFHDLRHTTATLLLRAGVDPYRVQRILRHSSVTVTTGTYGHLVVEDLRAAINTLPAGPVAPKFEPIAATGTAPRGAGVVQKVGSAQTAVRSGAKSSEYSAAYLVGPSGFEPLTPTVSTAVGSSDAFTLPRPDTYPPDSTGVGFRPVQPVGPGRAGAKALFEKRGAGVVQPSPLRAAPAPLLTVRDVAEHLRISTATVYALVERGELAHVRVSNAIRVKPADLTAFIERQRGSS